MESLDTVRRKTGAGAAQGAAPTASCHQPVGLRLFRGEIRAGGALAALQGGKFIKMSRTSIAGNF